MPKILENPGDARIASVPIRNGALDARSSDGIGGGPDTLPRYNVSLGRSRLCFKRWAGKRRSALIAWGYRTPNGAAAKRKL